MIETPWLIETFCFGGGGEGRGGEGVGWGKGERGERGGGGGSERGREGERGGERGREGERGGERGGTSLMMDCFSKSKMNMDGISPPMRMELGSAPTWEDTGHIHNKRSLQKESELLGVLVRKGKGKGGKEERRGKERKGKERKGKGPKIELLQSSLEKRKG